MYPVIFEMPNVHCGQNSSSLSSLGICAPHADRPALFALAAWGPQAP